MLLGCPASEILLLSHPKIYSSVLKRWPASWWDLQGIIWKADKNNTPNLKTSSLSGPYWGEGEWEVSLEVPCPWLEDCLEAPDEWDARLHPWATLQIPVASMTDGKQMFNFAGRKCSEIWNWGPRRPFSSVSPHKQIEERKLHPSIDPARGLNCNRLKTTPCFNDLCNLKGKKKYFIVRFANVG